MTLLSISRYLSASIRIKIPKFARSRSLSIAGSLSPADKIWTHLQKNGFNIEKTLNTVDAELNTSCVNEVLQRFAIDKPAQLGLRFFIWAGLQPSYRHSSYMYGNACKLFGINRNPRLVTDVIESYTVEGCLVSVKTFKVVLNLCREAKIANEGLWVLRKMKEFNIRPDTISYNVVIRLFIDKNDMDMAMELMREMGLIDLYPDMITYISMVKGFCDSGRIEDACGLFKIMKTHGISPNSVLYSSLLDGVCKYGNMDRALKLLREMEKEGGDCSPNVVTYTSIIQSFCKKNRSIEALKIFDQMEAYGCLPNRITISTLINGFCKDGYTQEAYKFIDKIVSQGIVSNKECYSSLTISLVRVKKIDEAKEAFRKMLDNGLRPDGLACSVLIKGNCFKKRVLDGFALFEEINKLGCLSSVDSDVYSVLLAGLCEESHLVEAEKLGRLMVERGVRVKASYVETIVKNLKNFKENELLSLIARMGWC